MNTTSSGAKLYYGLAGATAVIALSLLVADFTLRSPASLYAYLILCFVAFSGALAQKAGWGRIGGALQGFALTPIIGAIGAAATVYAATVSLPFADPVFAAADRALGFDWLSHFAFYEQNPWIGPFATVAYNSFNTQILVVPAILFLTGRDGRGWQFLWTWTFALAVTVAIFPFVPAVGPYAYYGLSPDDLHTIPLITPWDTGPLIEGIRNGSIRELDRAVSGLVAFPSFHTAAAILFTWAFWPLRIWRYPALILNACLILSTLVRGSHYLTDLLGGGLVAIVSIAAIEHYSRNRIKPFLPVPCTAE